MCAALSGERHPAEFQNLAVRYTVHQQQIKGECPIMLIISQDEPYSHQPCEIPGNSVSWPSQPKCFSIQSRYRSSEDLAAIPNLSD